MHPILLALALTVSGQTVKIGTLTPSAGSWSVQVSQDLVKWRVVASGACTAPEHVCATIQREQMGFVRVEFWPRP